jgi:hypothetical protein
MKSYIICGLGGSGSRLLGEIFHILDFDMGGRLNKSYDNLDTFAASAYYRGMSPFNDHNYTRFKKLFIKQIANSYVRDTLVIKEPNYHLFLPFLKKISLETQHEMKFLHIIRDGLYMMNSKNQNQYNRWHKWFPLQEKLLKYKQLEFWYIVNKRALELYESLDFDVHIVKYDELVENPKCEIEKILEFIEKDLELYKFDDFISKIKAFKPNRKKETIDNIPTYLKNKLIGWI